MSGVTFKEMRKAASGTRDEINKLLALVPSEAQAAATADMAAQYAAGNTKLITPPQSTALAALAGLSDWTMPIKDGAGNVRGVDLKTIFMSEAPYYVSGSGRVFATVGVTAAGSTSVVLDSVATLSVGQGLYISGAGTAGMQYKYVGLILSISGNTVGLDRATTTEVADGTRVLHDNTIALQSAVDEVSSGAGRRLLFPPGVICVNGGLPNYGDGIYSMIGLPSIPFTRNPSEGKAASIVFEGMLQTTSVSHFAVDATDLSGSVIKTECTTAGSLLYGSCGTSYFGTFTNLFVQTKNISFQAPDDPAICILNFRNVAAIRITDTSIGTTISQVEQSPAPTFPPTHTTGVALVTPGPAGAGVNYIDGLNVSGFHDGINVMGDHVHISSAYFALCKYPIEMDIGYGLSADRIVVDVAYAALSGTTHDVGFVNIDTMTVSQASYGILDASNALTGYVGLYCDTNTPTPVSGAARLRVKTLGTQVETYSGFTGYPRLSTTPAPTVNASGDVSSLTHTVAVPADKEFEVRFDMITNANAYATLLLNGATIAAGDFVGGMAGNNTVPQWDRTAFVSITGVKYAGSVLTFGKSVNGWRTIKGFLWNEVGWTNSFQVSGATKIGAITSIGASIGSANFKNGSTITVKILND